MATNKNITMRQFNGVDYDTLYPKTSINQIEGLVGPMRPWKYVGKINKIQNKSSSNWTEWEYLKLIDYGENGGYLNEINSILIIINELNTASLPSGHVPHIVNLAKSLDGTLKGGSGAMPMNQNTNGALAINLLKGMSFSMEKSEVSTSQNYFSVRYTHPFLVGSNQSLLFSCDYGTKFKEVGVAFGFYTSPTFEEATCDIDVYIQ